MSDATPTPITAEDHLVLAERALASTEAALDRLFSLDSSAALPTPADMQGVLFALSVAQCHSSIANAQLMAEPRFDVSPGHTSVLESRLPVAFSVARSSCVVASREGSGGAPIQVHPLARQRVAP